MLSYRLVHLVHIVVCCKSDECNSIFPVLTDLTFYEHSGNKKTCIMQLHKTVAAAFSLKQCGLLYVRKINRPFSPLPTKPSQNNHGTNSPLLILHKKTDCIFYNAKADIPKNITGTHIIHCFYKEKPFGHVH